MINLSQKIIQEIHDPVTGRIDAMLFADYLGIIVSEMAQILGCSVVVLRRNKTNLKLSYQRENLVNLYVVVNIVKNKYGDDFRMWLNAPNHQLNNKTPIENLRFGGKDRFNKLMVITQEEPAPKINFEWLEELREDELKDFIVELVYETNYQNSDLVHEWRETAILNGYSESEDIFAIEDDDNE